MNVEDYKGSVGLALTTYPLSEAVIFLWFSLRFRFRTRRWTSQRSPPSVGLRLTSSTSLVSGVSRAPGCLGFVALPWAVWVSPCAFVISLRFLGPHPTHPGHSPQPLSANGDQSANLSLGGGTAGKGCHVHRHCPDEAPGRGGLQAE